jgi:hypothetical protein
VDHLRHLVYSGFLQKETFAHFLQHYGGTATLDRAEINALPDYIGCIWLSMSLFRLLQRHPEGLTETEPALREVLALGTWASRNAQSLRSTAQAALEAANHNPLEHSS